MHTTALKIGDVVVGGRDFLRRKKMTTSSETSGNKQQRKCPLYVNYSIKIPLATVGVSVGCRAYYFIVKLKYQKRTFD
jgi:hypothetical protein